MNPQSHDKVTFEPEVPCNQFFKYNIHYTLTNHST